MRRILPTLLLLVLLVSPAAALVREKKVFQASLASTDFGYNVHTPSPSGGYDTWYEYTAGNPCTKDDAQKKCLSDIASGNNPPWAFLGKTLTGEKQAYRVLFDIYPATDGATSGFYASFSFVKGPAISNTGDGEVSGFFKDSAQARFKETTSGWDISIGESTNGAYTELGAASDNRDTDHFHVYAFTVDARNGYMALRNDLDEEILNATLVNHQGLPIYSQWFMGRNYGSFLSSHLFLGLSGDSTTILDIDPRPPQLADVRQSPARVQVNQAFTVSATATDDWGAPSVKIKHWVNGVSGRDIATTRTGTTNAGTIPGEAEGARIRYQVVATDSSGLESHSSLYEVTVGSNSGPTDLGGASTGGGDGDLDSGLGGNWDGIALGLVIAVVAVGLFFLLKNDPKTGKLAVRILLAGILLGFGSFLYLSNQESITAFLQGIPLVAWASIAVAVLLVVALLLRRRGAS